MGYHIIPDIQAVHRAQYLLPDGAFSAPQAVTCLCAGFSQSYVIKVYIESRCYAVFLAIG